MIILPAALTGNAKNIAKFQFCETKWCNRLYILSSFLTLAFHKVYDRSARLCCVGPGHMEQPRRRTADFITVFSDVCENILKSHLFGCYRLWKLLFYWRYINTRIHSFIQGSVATRLWGGIFNDHFIANLVENVTVKKFWKSASDEIMCRLRWLTFLAHPV